MATRLNRGFLVLGVLALLAIASLSEPQTRPSRAMRADVAAFVQRLKSDDAVGRAEAAAGLGRLGPEALPALPALLELHSNSTSLWRSEGATLVHTSVRGEALGAIERIGSKAVPELIRVVDDLGRDDKLRAFAAVALGGIKDKRGVPPLIASLSDVSHEVVAEGAAALGQIGDSRAVEPLIPLLTHKDQSVAASAAKSLAQIGDPRALEPLISAIPVWRERRCSGIADSLAAFPQDPRVIPALVELIQRDGDFFAIIAVGKLRARAAVNALIPHLKSDSQPIRCNAAEALGLIKDKGAVDPLINALRTEKNEAVIHDQIKALQIITGRRLGSNPSKWLEWWDAGGRPQ